MITPEQVEAMTTGTNTATSHGEIFLRALPALLVAGAVGTLLIVQDILRVETWRGRLAVYVSKMTGGLGAAYCTLLALSEMPRPISYEMEQVCAIAAFFVGRDTIYSIARKVCGIKTRIEDER